MRTPLPLVAVLALVGCAAPISQERSYIDLPGGSLQAPFSDAVLAGNTLYVAGRLGIDPQTGRPPADPAEEARLLLDSIRDVLAEAGMTMNDLVSVQVFCSDISLFGTWNEVYRTYFDAPYPARAFIGSGPLLSGARFEMMGTAIRSSSR